MSVGPVIDVEAWNPAHSHCQLGCLGNELHAWCLGWATARYRKAHRQPLRTAGALAARLRCPPGWGRG